MYVIEGKVSSLFGGLKVTSQDYAKVAATEHPMSANMRESLEQTLTNHRTCFKKQMIVAIVFFINLL